MMHCRINDCLLLLLLMRFFFFVYCCSLFTNAIHQCAVCNDDSRHGRGLSFLNISFYCVFFHLLLHLHFVVWFTIRVLTEFDGNERDEFKMCSTKEMVLLLYGCTVSNEKGKALHLMIFIPLSVPHTHRKINFSYVFHVSRFLFLFSFYFPSMNFRIRCIRCIRCIRQWWLSVCIGV